MKRSEHVGWQLVAVLLFATGPCSPGAATAGAGEDVPRVAAVFQTGIEEPWSGVIHRALRRAQKEQRVRYEWTDKLAAGDFERTLREYAEKNVDLIVGDAFGQERAVRRVAKTYPGIKFLFGSGLGPAPPNLGVFDNWVHEPAYLCGMIAGQLTRTNVVGVVGGYPVAEVNRLINAFKAGAATVNPEVTVKVAFIDSWFDPPRARQAALAQIDSGADLLYAERHGVIEAARERGKLAFGNLLDQHELAPDTVITGPVWDMYPVVRLAIESIRKGDFAALDYAQWSMMQQGGARLAPLYAWEERLPRDLLAKVRARQQEILRGLFRVPVDESEPASD